MKSKFLLLPLLLSMILVLAAIAVVMAATEDFDYGYADYQDNSIDWNSVDYFKIPPQRYDELPYDKIDFRKPGLNWQYIDYDKIPTSRYTELPYDRLDFEYTNPKLKYGYLDYTQVDFERVDHSQISSEGVRKYMQDLGCQRCELDLKPWQWSGMEYQKDGFSHVISGQPTTFSRIKFGGLPPNVIFSINEDGWIEAKVGNQPDRQKVETDQQTTVIVQTTDQPVEVEQAEPAAQKAPGSASSVIVVVVDGAASIQDGVITQLDSQSTLTAADEADQEDATGDGKKDSGETAAEPEQIQRDAEIPQAEKPTLATFNEPMEIGEAAKWAALYEVQRQINRQLSTGWTEAASSLVAMREELKSDLGITGAIPSRQIQRKLNTLGTLDGNVLVVEGRGELRIGETSFRTDGGIGGVVMVQNVQEGVWAVVGGTATINNGGIVLKFEENEEGNVRITADASAIINSQQAQKLTATAGSRKVRTSQGRDRVTVEPATTLTKKQINFLAVLQNPKSLADEFKVRWGYEPKIAEELALIFQELKDSGITEIYPQSGIRTWDEQLEGNKQNPRIWDSPERSRHVSRKEKLDKGVTGKVIGGDAIDVCWKYCLDAKQKKIVTGIFNKYGYVPDTHRNHFVRKIPYGQEQVAQR